jgi:hypothetical protein
MRGVKANQGNRHNSFVFLKFLSLGSSSLNLTTPRRQMQDYYHCDIGDCEKGGWRSSGMAATPISF